MNEQRAGTVLRLSAVLTFGLGALLVMGSWDGLYDPLDLPQALPALLAQVGGVALTAMAFLLWRAATALGELRQVVAAAAAMAHGGAALVIAAWLLFRGKIDLEVGTQGIVELIVAAVVLGALALAETAIARSRPARTGETRH